MDGCRGDRTPLADAHLVLGAVWGGLPVAAPALRPVEGVLPRSVRLRFGGEHDLPGRLAVPGTVSGGAGRHGRPHLEAVHASRYQARGTDGGALGTLRMPLGEGWSQALKSVMLLLAPREHRGRSGRGEKRAPASLHIRCGAAHT